MKVIVTGDFGLSKNLQQELSNSNHIVDLINLSELDSLKLSNIINEYDVFINCEYKDTAQTQLFESVYSEWKFKEKTIVNILTSGLVFGSPNKKYIDDKRNLEQITFDLRSDDKVVRIINVYPNTLESSITVPFQKLKYSEVSRTIKYIVELPQDLEIFQIGISRTTLELKRSLL